MSGLSLGTRVSNLKSVALTVLELLAFNSLDRPLRTHTDKHISNEHIISAIHFVHLAEITRLHYVQEPSTELVFRMRSKFNTIVKCSLAIVQTRENTISKLPLTLLINGNKATSL